MGKLIKKLRERAAAKRAAAAPKAPGAPGSPNNPRAADWLLAKHRADQGFGSAPADPNATPTTPAPETGAGGAGGAPSGAIPDPTGGMLVDEDELRRRKAAGLNI